MNIQLPTTACTGCSACMNTCSVGAITMVEQTDGFLYPRIDDEKCIKCGQCMKACHALGFEGFRQPSQCYAAQIKDKDVLKASTSGGLFHALAESILSEGGAVYACNYDDDYNAFIQRFDAVEQIAPVHGSKYVWSDSSLSYPLVKKDLDDGKTVLYTGLPCQIAGLRKYLKKEVVNQRTGELLKSSDLTAVLDLEKLKTDYELMGYYTLATSEINMDDKQMIDTYGNLVEIEEQFRVMKTTLDVRPVYVRTKEHIMAHLTICTVALIVLRLIQRQIKEKHPEVIDTELLFSHALSADRIQTALKNWKIEKIGDIYYRFCDTDDPDLALILDSFGIAIPKKCFKISEILQLKAKMNLST